MARAPRTVLLGIDAGGTKTVCSAFLVEDGRFSVQRDSGSNYQSVGIARATEIWERLIGRSVADLGRRPDLVSAAGLGIAGLDRLKDRVRIERAMEGLLPSVSVKLTNDADLVLRAGTDDGVGVAVISGTGCNAMGVSRSGKHYRVGGIGPEFGDLGSGSDIGVEALRKAFRSLDGRDPPTILVDIIVGRMQLDSLDDIVDYFLADSQSGGRSEGFGTGLLAPLVFEAAEQGDEPARSILVWAGLELAASARAVARKLFAPDAAFPLVMGGSVLQRGRSTRMRDALVRSVQEEFPAAWPVVIDVQPVAGGLLYALDLLVQEGRIKVSSEARQAAVSAVRERFRVDLPPEAGGAGRRAS